VPVGGGVFKTTDGGNSWASINNGFPVTAIQEVVVDPHNPATVYADGVYRSTDSGGHWTGLTAGLTSPVLSLAIRADGTVYAGTRDTGVFQLSNLGEEILAGVVPAAISAPGAAGSLFRTAIQLRNSADPEAQTAPASLVGHLIFHPSGASGSPNDPSLPFALAPGQVLAIPDVLATMGQAGIGSLDVLTTTGSMPVGVVRVFNDAGAAGTYGFSEDALPLSDALNADDHGILLAPPDLTLFRWNIGIRTLAAGAIVTLTVHDAQGTLTRTAIRSFGPNVMVQESADAFIVDDAHPGPQPPLGANDSLTVKVNAGNAFVYGAIADNKTNDPSFELARRLP
jgi:hypothetical protein